MAIALRRAESEGDLLRFIQFPRKIYTDASLWVPPLDYERKVFLNPKVNPYFDHAEVEHFLACTPGGKIKGRISAIVDRDHNAFHNENTGFFGMFESINDPAVASTLLDAAGQWCRDKGMDRMRGPMNLSTNHECGLLVENFDDPPVFGLPYNPPYYADLFQQWGLQKLKDLISFEIQITGIPPYLERAVTRIKKRNHFTLRSLNMRQFDREIETFWNIYNSAWETNWGFVPMNRKEFVFAASEMKRIVNPELCFVAEVNGEAAGFSLTLPDVNQPLRKLNGQLFPFGWLKFIQGKKNIDRYRVITLGVKKKFQRLGIDACFYHATYQKLLDLNIPMADLSWVLEENQAIIGPIKKIGGTPYKRHRIYEHNLIH